MVTELWAFFNSRTRPRVNRVYQLETQDALLGRILNAADHIRNSRSCYEATRAVHNRAAACVAAGGGIFENHL